MIKRELSEDKNTCVIAAAVIAAIVIGYLFYGWLKKRRAEQLMTTANAQIFKLRDVINQANNGLKANQFIMTGQDEIDPLDRIIKSNLVETDNIAKALEPIAKLLADGEHDKVNEMLADPESPIKRAERCENEIRSKVLGYLNKKRQNRDTTIDNEWFLKARLKKPIQPGMMERPDDLKDIPMNYFSMIPTGTLNLSGFGAEAGGAGDDRLNNSLGANLISHRQELDHIMRFGRNEGVKQRANALYGEAVACYLRVRDANDNLGTFYRAEKHDGKYSMDDYNRLLAAQNVPVNDIKRGDESLKNLTAYLAELHDQYYTYVTKQYHEARSFRHTRTVTNTDEDGETHWDTETYYTHGYAYFYTLATIRPSGKSEKNVEVGEIDSLWRDWDYDKHEKVGWIREWKRLHEDRTTIVSGWERDLHPMIEAE